MPRPPPNESEQMQLAGDRGFLGVNMRLDPSQLSPGYVSEAVNMRFTKGIAETRKGLVKLVWANRPFVEGGITRAGGTATFTATENHGFVTGDTVAVYGANETDYNVRVVITVTGLTTFTYAVANAPASPATGFPSVTASNVYPWGEIHGTGVFSSPTTFVKYLIIAAAGKVYYSFANNHGRRIALPAMVTLTGRVTFVQAFDKLLMFRGESLQPLEMVSVETGFVQIIQTPGNVESGVANIPNADRALFFQNRLVIGHGNDEVALSDLGDYTHYQPTMQDFRINQGSADKLINVVKFNDTTLICFKDHSIYAEYNVYGNLAAVQQDELTNQFGLVAPESVAHVGKDLWFLSELGVMSITQTDQNKVQGVVLPVSDPIQPLIDRINWRYAGPSSTSPGAVAAYHDNKYYLAVPLDDAELLGDELIQNTVFYYFAGVSTIVGLTAGKTYRYTLGSTVDTNLVNGTETLTISKDFVAQGTSVVLHGQSGSAVTASVRRVTKGVNNSVLVYDFLNQAWSGYDQADGLDVKQWVEYEYNNIRRLFAVTSEGYVLLYEEDFEDQLTVPYTLLGLSSSPVTNDTLRVNRGTLVTAWTNAQDAAHWNVAGPANFSGQGLWFDDETHQFGYAPDNPGTVWTAPNTIEIRTITDNYGIKFISTNGLIPSVVTTGTWATVIEHNTQQIISYVTTRSYSPPQGEFEIFKWLDFDVLTWNPSYNVDVITDGASETFNLKTSLVKDRTKWYRPFDKADFNVENPSSLYIDKYREDYSLAMTTGTTGAGLAAQIDIQSTIGGVPLDTHQEAREVFHVPVLSSRNLRVKITNSQGRFRLMALRIHGDTSPLRAGSNG